MRHTAAGGTAWAGRRERGTGRGTPRNRRATGLADRARSVGGGRTRGSGTAGVAEGGSAQGGDRQLAARGDAHDADVDRGAFGDGERELPVGTAEIASGR